MDASAMRQTGHGRARGLHRPVSMAEWMLPLCARLATAEPVAYTPGVRAPRKTDTPHRLHSRRMTVPHTPAFINWKDERLEQAVLGDISIDVPWDIVERLSTLERLSGSP